MPIELDTKKGFSGGAKIRVIGIGGGGGNAVNSMINLGLDGVDFIVANTDIQALQCNLAPIKIQIGKETTRGLGAGADPEIGRISIEENYDDIRQALVGSDMIFITAGMGGGTGTGGAPIAARIGRELGALVVGVVTKPFNFEARKRMSVAEKGIDELRAYVDALLIIPNQKLIDITDRQTTFKDAYLKVDNVLYNATRGIADIITRPGIVNVDFADVRTVMKGMGDALMGTGTAIGENRAVEATENALNSPLLDGITIAGAQGVLVNITAPPDLGIHEVDEAVSIIESRAGSDVNLIYGVVFDNEGSKEFKVTVVATGFNKKEDKSMHEMKTTYTAPKFNGDNKDYNKIPSHINPPLRINQPLPYSEKKFGGISIPDKVPTGHKELLEYDKPAITRMEKFTEELTVSKLRMEDLNTDRIDDRKRSNGAINVFIDNLKGSDDLSKELKKPTILRRMID